MRENNLSRFLPALALPLLLAACGQSPTSDTDPYANGASYPWSYSAPAGQLTPQRLTPGWNNLYFEPILAASNSWGPTEINRSNGEQGAGDGRPLTLNGRTYDRGYGTHAGSELRFSLKGTNADQCTRFTADIGVDDEVGNRGSVVFQVYLDGNKVYDSGKMTGASATRKVDLDVSGKQELRLIVTNAGDGIDYDHADWARPMILCQEGQLADVNYVFRFDPDTITAPNGQDTTATLVVTDTGYPNDPRPPSGPVSFRLGIFEKSFADIHLVEPDRLYTATSFPARFPVRIHLEAHPPVEGVPEPTGDLLEFVAQLEGYTYPLYTNRFDLTWHASGGAVSLPVVRGFRPTSGPTAGGTLVEIWGQNLQGARVQFGERDGTDVRVSPNGTDLFVTAPPAPAGPVNVVVVTPGGAAVVGQYTYR